MNKYVEGENQQNERKQDTFFRSFCENEREISMHLKFGCL